MAVITNYETLLTAVADYVARDDLTSFAANFVQNWEERFYRDPQNFASWMEATASLTTSSAAVPADYLAIKYATVQGDVSSAPLQRVALAVLLTKFPRGASGKPRMIAKEGSSFVFGPEPDSDYTLTLRYYAKPTLLRNDADGANWLTLHAPDLCLYGALLEAEPFLKNDGRIAVWRDFYTDALAAYRDQQRDEEFMGSPMVAVLA